MSDYKFKGSEAKATHGVYHVEPSSVPANAPLEDHGFAWHSVHYTPNGGSKEHLNTVHSKDKAKRIVAAHHAKITSARDDIQKSNTGPKGTAAGAQYMAHVNQERKSNNVETINELGPNKNVKQYSTKAGQLSAKQQAAAENSKSRVKSLSGKPRTLSREEIAALNIPAPVKKDEMLEIEPDGKQEMVEGKEPLKKDPSKRWKALKKALEHKKAFMDLEDAMGENEEAEQPQPDQQAEGQQPQGDPAAQQQAPESEDAGQAQPEQEGQEGGGSPPEAVSEGQEGEQEQPQEDEQAQPDQEGQEPLLSPKDEQMKEQVDSGELDPQELIDALTEEGYSEQEIAYIVHGQHAPEVDPTKQAKAQATSAMSDIDIENAKKQAELERAHQEQSMAAEREHKKRMSDLEFEHHQKKHALVDQDAAHKQRMSDVEYEQAQQANPQALEQEHKKRMLDLEYEKAKRESQNSDGSEGDAEANKQMKMLEVEKKKLELNLRKEEMKMELEFKKREHELKLKMMEQQLKDQAKQKGEISGIKHEQNLANAKKPPEKKPLKKSEDDNE